MKKKTTRSAGGAVGAIFGGLIRLIGGLLKLILKAIFLLGLWVPGLYALFGVVLHYTLGFEPFDFSTFSTFYIVGGIVCIVIVVIISAYNLFINPIKKRAERKRKMESAPKQELQPPLTEEKRKRSFFGKKRAEETPLPPKREVPVSSADYSDAQSLDWMPAQETPEIAQANSSEHPEVYFSTLKPDILVHEYHDRFELFRVEGNKLVSIGTEYK